MKPGQQAPLRTILEQPLVARVGAEWLPAGLVCVWSTGSRRRSDPNFGRPVATMEIVASNKVAESKSAMPNLLRRIRMKPHDVFIVLFKFIFARTVEKLVTRSAPCC